MISLPQTYLNQDGEINNETCDITKDQTNNAPRNSRWSNIYINLQHHDFMTTQQSCVMVHMIMLFCYGLWKILILPYLSVETIIPPKNYPASGICRLQPYQASMLLFQQPAWPSNIPMIHHDCYNGFKITIFHRLREEKEFLYLNNTWNQLKSWVAVTVSPIHKFSQGRRLAYRSIRSIVEDQTIVRLCWYLKKKKTKFWILPETNLNHNY